MYSITADGRIVHAVELQQRLGDKIEQSDLDEIGSTCSYAMRHMVEIENLEARGEQYNDHHKDVLWGAYYYLRDFDYYAHEEREAIKASKRGDEEEPIPHPSQNLSCFI